MARRIGSAFLRGTLASVVGLTAMDAYFRALEEIKERRPRRRAGGTKSPRQHAPEGDDVGPLDDISLVGRQGRPGEPSTEVVGRRIYEALKGDKPPGTVQGRLGKAVHWGYGMAVGGLYGVLRARGGNGEIAAGAGYGAALWLFGDELAVPLLGLSKGPTGVPGRIHAEALGAHLVYGMTTSAAVKALRRVF